MKEEVRRENDLEAWLVSHSAFIKAYWKPVTLIAALILVVFIVWASVKNAQVNNQKKLWAEYFTISSAEGKTPEEMQEALDAFAKAHLNSLPGSMVAYREAIRLQVEGFQKIGANDLAAAKEALEKSKKLFSDLVSANVNDKMTQMAKFSLAKNAELMAQVENSEENIKAAKDLYSQVAKTQDAYGRKAQQILDVYKLDEANIIALSTPAQTAVTPGEVSASQEENVELDVPNPEMLAPETGEAVNLEEVATPAAKTPAAETPATETPATETPAPETPAPETPAAETPAAETPATEAPAPEAPAPETPAAETPAAETPAAETPAAETPAAETPAAETPAAETPAAEAAPGEPAAQN